MSDTISSKAAVILGGRDKAGVIYKITKIIYEVNGNVVDLTQKIAGSFFTMLIIVDISKLSVDFKHFKELLNEEAKVLDVNVMVFLEDVLRSVNRI